MPGSWEAGKQGVGKQKTTSPTGSINDMLTCRRIIAGKFLYRIYKLIFIDLSKDISYSPFKLPLKLFSEPELD
jgi:hypothetical protein